MPCFYLCKRKCVEKIYEFSLQIPLIIERILISQQKFSFNHPLGRFLTSSQTTASAQLKIVQFPQKIP